MKLVAARLPMKGYPMDRDRVFVMIREIVKDEQLHNPKIMICVDGEVAEIEEVNFDEFENALIIHDGSFDSETAR